MMINISASFEESVNLIDTLASSCGEPSWMADIRRAGLVSSRTLPMPSRRQAEWKRSSPKWFFPSLDKSISLASEQLAVGTFAEQSELREELQSLGITDFGEENKTEINLEESGFIDNSEIFVSSLTYAAQQENSRECLEKSFFKADHHQHSLSCALNAALRTGGSYVSIKDGASLKNAVYIRHSVKNAEASENAQNAFFSHSVICAENPCRAAVVEDFSSEDGKELLAHTLIELDVSSGASLTYVLVSDWSKEAKCLNTIHVRLGRDASLKIIFAGLGGAASKTFFSEDLNNTGAHTELYGIVMADGRQHFDTDTFVHHKVPRGYSNVLFNSAVSGRARTVFTGNILVDGAAQLTDAYQKNKNLLLSKNAKAESMPKLEIIADDVKCTHGASFTEYDEDQLFYLESRGLSQEAAKGILTAGFFQEISEQIDCSAAACWLSEKISEKSAE